MQEKIIDVIDPLSALHENNSIMFESLEDETLNLDRVTIVALFGSVGSRDICPSFSKPREQVLAKLDPVPASLADEHFPDSGNQLFWYAFETHLKIRSENAILVADA